MIHGSDFSSPIGNYYIPRLAKSIHLGFIYVARKGVHDRGKDELNTQLKFLEILQI